MYRTTSVLALGLFFGLAPVGAHAQTQSDDTQVQVQTTQPSSDTQTQTDTTQANDQQATDSDTAQSGDQQSTDVKVDIPDDKDADVAADTETSTGDDAEMKTETEVETTTDDDAEMATDTETETTTDDDAEMATDDDTATEEAEVETTEAKEVPEVIPEQDTSEMLGSSLMGASVNLADEEIGTVSDLIVADDYSIRGVVVGVGGFLGIGEKRVALPVERLTFQMTEPGEVEISTDMTREELEEKEAFKTAEQVKSEEEAAQAQQEAEAQQPVAPAAPAD